MKHLLLISIAALSLGACQAATSEAPSSAATAAPASQMSIETAPVKAVRIYADWCPKCKVLDAQLKTLRAQNEYPNIDFIYLDFTAKDADTFYAQAREHGIEEQVKTAFGGGRIRTGQMFIFDAKSDALLKTITHNMSDAELAAELTSES